MPTTQEQKDVFLRLKADPNSNAGWIDFWAEWDGFLFVIIRKKLFFAPDLWEEAKALTDAKLYKYIGRFDASREISPWLARVVVSACEDVKRESGYRPLDADADGARASAKPVSIEDEDVLAWMNAQARDAGSDDELLSCLWLCVEQSIEKRNIDRRRVTAFFLFYRYGFKLREIAAVFGMSATVVNNWPRGVFEQILPDVKEGMAALGYGSGGPEARLDGSARRRI